MIRLLTTLSLVLGLMAVAPVALAQDCGANPDREADTLPQGDSEDASGEGSEGFDRRPD